MTALVLGLGCHSAQAILVTPDTDANSLAAALTAGASGFTLISATLQGQNNGAGVVSTGTFTNASGTYGIGDGIVLSTGNVSDYGDGPNVDSGTTTAYGVPATAAQEALLDPITGGTFNHNDVTQLDITFLAEAGRLLHEPKYLHAARRAADHLWNHHRQGERLLRASFDGRASGDGLQEDYAFLAEGLLAL